MCFHSVEEVDRYLQRTEYSQENRGIIKMRDFKGNFQEAYHCDALDPQDIANVVRNLRAWHPGDHLVDLYHVNMVRSQHGRSLLSEDMLPAPKGKAPASEDQSDHDGEQTMATAAPVVDNVWASLRDRLEALAQEPVAHTEPPEPPEEEEPDPDDEDDFEEETEPEAVKEDEPVDLEALYKEQQEIYWTGREVNTWLKRQRDRELIAA